MPDNSQFHQKNESLLERDLGEEVVVMSPLGNELHTFEGSARFIWNMIDNAQAMDKLLARITEEYQVETAVARSDLEVFLAELRRLSLIETKSPATAGD